MAGLNSLVNSVMKPHFTKRWELTKLDGYIIWSSGVLISPQACEHIAAELHGGHPGGARIKSFGMNICMVAWYAPH